MRGAPFFAFAVSSEADYQLPWAFAIAWVKAPIAAASVSLEGLEEMRPVRFPMA